MPRPPSLPDSCNVLLVGNGGREHALAWKLRQSPRLGNLFASAPTNAGIASLAQLCDLELISKYAFRINRWCDEHNIHFVIIGPEAPLADGLADALRESNRVVFGPTKEAARLEFDKAFSKTLMRSAAIPTAEARPFTDFDSAHSYVTAHEEPCVVKASGLAAGKGAIVCNTQREALEALDRMFIKREFGSAADTVLIEEKLAGPEVSVLALVDGRTIAVLDPCQDHKQVGENDTGPNTGGMGAYCPAPVISRAVMAEVERHILVPTIDALRRDGVEFRGVLYVGLMLTPAGPKVLEYNTRFGDPECQPLMMRLRTDLLELLWATATGTLDKIDVDFDDRAACCVVMCSAGYPDKYEKNKPITGIEDAESLSTDSAQVQVFHAGTTADNFGNLVTNGGRVLSVTALASDLRTARDLANAACDRIHFPGSFFRRDIAHRALKSAPALTR